LFSKPVIIADCALQLKCYAESRATFGDKSFVTLLLLHKPADVS